MVRIKIQFSPEQINETNETNDTNEMNERIERMEMKIQRIDWQTQNRRTAGIDMTDMIEV